MSEWMLWGRFGGSVQLGSAPPPRLYVIPLSSSVEHEGPLAPALGHRNRDERTLEDLTRALDRAVSSESDGVVFPSSFLTSPFREEAVTRCRNRKLRIVHQVTTDALISNGAPERSEELMRRLEAGDAVNLVFGGSSLPKETWLARLTRWPEQVYFTYSVRVGDPAIDILHRLQPFVRERLFFHFPYHLETGDGHLSCHEVFELTEKIRSRVPGVRVRPMLGTELYDPRVDSELELEPLHSPRFELRSGDGADHKNRVPIEFSVIIPSYNNREYLINTIRHLVRQNFPRANFEIIVVDDGSNDGSELAVQDELRPLEGQINFKYIYSPRIRPRKMGDANYRAGISRNLGVKNALGRILCFLDSDILTPPNYLSDLLVKHRRYDVVQCKRLNLVREKSTSTIRFDEVDPAFDTFATEDGYWEKFYAVRDWAKLPFFWKYTCTYGLSLPTTLFKRVGWIRRGFVFYGFEDVELGYRLARVGARFHLNEMATYHLFHRNERSEFHNSDYLRQSLLAKTAQIFYLGRLEPEIYQHFRGLMKEQIPMGKLISLGWFQIPVLAIWNWRWFLWRNWNRLKTGIRLTLIEMGAPVDDWVRKLDKIHRRLQLHHLSRILRLVWSHRWRLGVFAHRSYGLLINVAFRASYPLRKIYYIGAYQWEKRVQNKTSMAERA